MNSSTCPRCGAEVLAGKTPKGRQVLLDPLPTAGGTAVEEDGRVLVFREPSGVSLRLLRKLRYRLHAKTCPEASDEERLLALRLAQ